MPSKILIIDDDPRIHALIKSQFDPRRFECISAHCGHTGIEVASSQGPDLILLDVDMPLTQGFEVCRQLKTDRTTRAIPIIFLTSAKGVEQTTLALECGACDYLTKPFHPTELQARVRAALRVKSEVDRSNQRSMYDELTEMFDRNYFEMRLDAELALARRSGRPLGCILIDIDDMSLVNTWFGPAVGDDVLKKVGQSILGISRREDVCCRYEEDQFGVLIGDANGKKLGEFSERARVAVRGGTVIHGERAVQVTASIGYALSRFSTGSSIVDEACEALSRAKACGGDCAREGQELTELRLAV